MWSNIIGQQRSVLLLRHAMHEQRVAHAYCFFGPEAVACEALALAFAQALNCAKPVDESPCGTCKSCVQMNALQHPNVQLIFALPTGKVGNADDSPISRLSDDQLALVHEEIARKSENLYHRISLDGATAIRINTIRDLKNSVRLAQSQQGRRVFIILNAETMTGEAANALLKTLEEPRDDITLILCTERRDLLPQTILSRCQQLQLEPLSDDVVADALHSRFHYTEAEARLTASLAQGSIRRALDIVDSDVRELREDIINLLRIAFRGGPYRVDMMNALDEMLKDLDRSAVRHLLSLLLTWLRDAFLLANGGSADLIVNKDVVSVLSKFSQAYASRDFPRAMSSVEDAIRALHGNAQIHITVLTTMLSLRRIFLSPQPVSTS